jgi:glycosyltransferase involved in cell wall biosynthesis
VTSVHLVVPDGIDDPAQPSGGNVYDRRLARGLTRLGWCVREHVAAGSWPGASDTARAALAALVARIPDRAVVVVDGLVASSAPDILVPEARRLRLVVLVHMPRDREAGTADRYATASADEQALLSGATAVLTTSHWTRDQLLQRYGLGTEDVHVVEPGVDAADVAAGSESGGSLLCVAAVAAHKGQDVLLAALAALRDRAWTCHLVGSLTRDPGFVAGLRRQARASRIDDRVCFAGPLSGESLGAAYARADALVLASHAETYGMVVTEALARGVPVVATSVGGVPQALGRAPDGTRPGLLVPAGDAAALAAALSCWLADAGLRERLRAAALDRRHALGGWDVAARAAAGVLSQVAA